MLEENRKIVKANIHVQVKRFFKRLRMRKTARLDRMKKLFRASLFFTKFVKRAFLDTMRTLLQMKKTTSTISDKRSFSLKQRAFMLLLHHRIAGQTKRALVLKLLRNDARKSLRHSFALLVRNRNEYRMKRSVISFTAAAKRYLKQSTFTLLKEILRYDRGEGEIYHKHAAKACQALKNKRRLLVLHHIRRYSHSRRKSVLLDAAAMRGKRVLKLKRGIRALKVRRNRRLRLTEILRNAISFRK